MSIFASYSSSSTFENNNIINSKKIIIKDFLKTIKTLEKDIQLLKTKRDQISKTNKINILKTKNDTSKTKERNKIQNQTSNSLQKKSSSKSRTVMENNDFKVDKKYIYVDFYAEYNKEKKKMVPRSSFKY